MSNQSLPISPDLLEILRDPYAIQQNHGQQEDPGRLELVHNSWLVSPETGYKYPIRDGIPVMLIEEGQRWQATPVADLPVPPPAPAAVMPGIESISDGETAVSNNNNLIIAAIAATAAILTFLILWQRLSKK